MKVYRVVDVYIHAFLTLVLVGGVWSASRLGHFTPGARDPGTPWIGSWVVSRTCLSEMEERKLVPLLGLEPRPLGRQAGSQLLD
jgi:hypothetical protein